MTLEDTNRQERELAAATALPMPHSGGEGDGAYIFDETDGEDPEFPGDILDILEGTPDSTVGDMNNEQAEQDFYIPNIQQEGLAVLAKLPTFPAASLDMLYLGQPSPCCKAFMAASSPQSRTMALKNRELAATLSIKCNAYVGGNSASYGGSSDSASALVPTADLPQLTHTFAQQHVPTPTPSPTNSVGWIEGERTTSNTGKHADDAAFNVGDVFGANSNDQGGIGSSEPYAFLEVPEETKSYILAQYKKFLAEQGVPYQQEDATFFKHGFYFVGDQFIESQGELSRMSSENARLRRLIVELTTTRPEAQGLTDGSVAGDDLRQGWNGGTSTPASSVLSASQPTQSRRSIMRRVLDQADGGAGGSPVDAQLTDETVGGSAGVQESMAQAYAHGSSSAPVQRQHAPITRITKPASARAKEAGMATVEGYLSVAAFSAKKRAADVLESGGAPTSTHQIAADGEVARTKRVKMSMEEGLAPDNE